LGTGIINAQNASSLGANVFASPWTPPDSMKSNTNVAGGVLNAKSYNSYALYLKSFGDYIKAGGVNLVGISIQNEPDAVVTYESCTWNSTSLLNFTKYNAPTIGYPLIMPESESFITSLSDPSIDDPDALKNITYIAGHIYGANPFTYTKAINSGKHVWMTEHYYNSLYNSIDTCLIVGKEISDCMYNNMNAYVWWWMLPLNYSICNLINSNNTLTLDGCALAQFAKWVRPGYKRVYTTYRPDYSVYVTAYKKGTSVVIVVVNLTDIPVSQPFLILNGSVTSVTPNVTSSSQSLAALPSISVVNGSFTATLGAQSITTFVSN